jgi:gamma-glutamyltranspeptidase
MENASMAQGPFSRGVVAAPHAAAAEAGRQILAEGGNAIEAMIAAAATIAAVYPHMTHVGGDGFWLIHQPSRRVHGIEACGFAGERATLKSYLDKGHYEIPSRGPLAALTVPGAVGGWRLANAMAKASGGTLPRSVMLEPAIRAAREGYKVSRSQASLTVDKLYELKDCPGFAETFLVGGKPPAEGTLMRQPALADSLEHLARSGFQDAYRGDIARELARDLEEMGSPVTRADLQAYYAVERTPLSLAHSLGTLHNMPPPTQGLASLMILGILDQLETLHGPVQAGYGGLRPPHRRGDQARLPGARPLRHRLRPARRQSRSTTCAPRRCGRRPAPSPSTAPCPGRTGRRPATRYGWAPPIRRAASSPTSSRSTGSSGRAACRSRPASSCRTAARASSSTRRR